MFRSVLGLALSLQMISAAEPFRLGLATANDHLFTGNPEKFYMYVDRNFEGEKSQPWTGGAFGFVRTPKRVDGEVVMTRFHEGIDIAPLKRDSKGNALDLIRSVSDGLVVYTNLVSQRSNYGLYVVVAHQWEDATVYSLYAHLSKIVVKPGDQVRLGSVLGQMGFTGRGLNRTRSHLHLEVGLLMSHQYETWHRKHFPSLNHHGIFNGMNLSGVDVAALLKEKRMNPNLTFREFVVKQRVQFTVFAPATKNLGDFLKRHPWMKMGDESSPRSWEIAFAATGHPISFKPSQRPLTKPIVSKVRPGAHDQRYLTRGLIEGDEKGAKLSKNGMRLLSLLMGDFSL